VGLSRQLIVLIKMILLEPFGLMITIYSLGTIARLTSFKALRKL